MGDPFHFNPETYLELIHREVPAYEQLQDSVADATSDFSALAVLDLGVGIGVTSQRILARHPGAQIVGIDESPAMLDYARRALPAADLRVARLQDPLPGGPFDLVISALAVHHLDGPEKADLFRRVAAELAPDGRFVLGDVVIPDNPADAVTPIEAGYDRPNSIGDQLTWLCDAGMAAHLTWKYHDLAILVGDRDGARRAAASP